MVGWGWREQAFGALPATIMLLLRGYVPESPKWMVASRAKAFAGDASSVTVSGQEGGCKSQMGTIYVDINYYS